MPKYLFYKNNIITGYIKQLLSTFNLPTCKIFDSEEALFDYLPKNTNLKDLIYIIKNYKDGRDSFVRIGTNNELSFVSYYNENYFYPNLTKTLAITDNIYDSNTHKYLGEYLRYIKDFKGINLLPLYNCYCNNMLELGNYKYLFIPVKYNNKYTINVNLNNIDYALSNSTKSKDLLGLTFSKTPAIPNNNNIFVINVDKPKSLSDILTESELTLVVRIPITKSVRFTCIEGDYSSNLSLSTNIQANFGDRDDSYDKVNLNQYISNLSLLQKNKSNVNEDYPFADRLVEYLTDSVITPNDLISQDIIDAKYKLLTRYCGKINPGKIWGDLSNEDRLKMVSALNINRELNVDKRDMLLYIDKDIEAVLDDERYPKSRR